MTTKSTFRHFRRLSHSLHKCYSFSVVVVVAFVVVVVVVKKKKKTSVTVALIIPRMSVVHT